MFTMNDVKISRTNLGRANMGPSINWKIKCNFHSPVQIGAGVFAQKAFSVLCKDDKEISEMQEWSKMPYFSATEMVF